MASKFKPYKGIKDFQKDYQRYGEYNLEVQVPHLAGLADHYKRKYNKTGNWTDCLKAHSLFNSVSVRQPDNEEWRKEAFKMQQKYWCKDSKVTFEEQNQITNKLKESLNNIRRKIRTDMVSAAQLADKYEEEDHERGLDMRLYNAVKKISLDCSELMSSLGDQIVQESVELLVEKPPCDFQAVAIGSLAKGEATPYSDLEYLFIIEEKTKQTTSYFEKLAITTYFLIGNLGETKLSYMAIDELQIWFKDTATNGLKIDGLTTSAGNIPTGNGLSKSRNHFIVTAEDLIQRYKDMYNNPTKESLQGDLTAMLTCTQPFYSKLDKGTHLCEEFRAQVDALTPNLARITMNMQMFEADITKFDFLPTVKVYEGGYNADVKKELYRFPSILLLDLCILLRAKMDTSWSTLERLIQRNSISTELGEVLKFSLAAAVYIRLSAYLYHNSHDDRMSVAATIRLKSASPARKRMRWFLPNDLYCKMHATLIPLKSRMSARCGNLKPQDVVTSNFSLNSVWSKVITQCFSGRFEKSLSTLKGILGDDLCREPVAALERIMPSLTEISVSTLVQIMAETMLMCKEFQSALTLYKYAFDKNIADRRCRIAECLSHLGKHEQAIETAQQITPLSPNQFFESEIYKNAILGEIYLRLGDHDKAEHHLTRALRFEYAKNFSQRIIDHTHERLFPTAFNQYLDCLGNWSEAWMKEMVNNPTPRSLDLIHKLGMLYIGQKKYELAKQTLTEALEGAADLYGENVKVLIMVDIMTALSSVYVIHGQTQEAIQYLDKSMAILNQYQYGSKSNARAGQIALAQNLLGSAFFDSNQFGDSLKYFTDCLNTLDQAKTIKSKLEPRLLLKASTLSSLSKICQKSQEFESAKLYAQECLTLYQQIKTLSVSEGIGLAYLQLGNIDRQLHQRQSSQRYLYFALSRLHKLNPSAELALTHHLAGMECPNTSQFYHYQEHCYQALAIFQKIPINAETMGLVADTYVNIGKNALFNGQRNEAGDAFRKALTIISDHNLHYEQTVSEIHRFLRYLPGPCSNIESLK